MLDIFNSINKELSAKTFKRWSHNIAPEQGFAAPVLPQVITPRDYQLAALQAALEAHRAILALDPGMGKTIVAQMLIAAVHKNSNGKTIVVVPPSLIIDPWMQEFEKQFPHLKVETVRGKKRAAFPDCDVIIIGDSIISDRVEDAIEYGASCLIIDEIHRMKTRTAARSKAVMKLADTINPSGFVIGMTGTLAVNRPDEVWQPLRIVGKHQATIVSGGPTFKDFKQVHCIVNRFVVNGGTPYARQVEVVVGCKDAKYLHDKLRESCMYRVEREDVLDLPDKLYVPHQLPLPVSALSEYRKAETEFKQWLANQFTDDAERSAKLTAAAKAEAIVRMTALYRLSGIAKIADSADYVANIVDQDEQVVVMAQHREVIEGLVTELSKRDIKTVTIVGGMSAEQKAEAVAKFRDGTARVLIGNIVAAGVGLNLEVACHLVFVQLPWSAGDFVQASDRIYRVTQTRTCTIHVLSGQGISMDEKMWQVMQKKIVATAAINSGTQQEVVTTNSIESEVLESYQ